MICNINFFIILDKITKKIKLFENNNNGRYLIFSDLFDFIVFSAVFNPIKFLDYLTKEFGFDIDGNINSSKSNNNGKYEFN